MPIKFDSIPCPFQGPGKENPAFIGGYDLIRPTDNPTDPDYWITSGTTEVYDAAYDNGAGGMIRFEDRLQISKGAVGGCEAAVTLDVKAKPLVFSYYPPHSLDVIFVLDVTSSMMSGSSRKMVLAKRALIQTINMLWQSNKDTAVTIVPYARDAFVPLPGGGLAYNYLGTFFTWRRSTTTGHMIGQILGYRNNAYVNTTDIPTYMEQSAPMAENIQQSLYNFYNYYKIQYSDIYNSDGSAKPDTILQNYLNTIYASDPSKYTGNFIEAVASGTPLTSAQLPYSMNDTGYENNTILDNLIWAIPYGEDTNTEAGLKESYTLLHTPGFAQSDDIYRRAVILITDGQANRSINPEYAGTYAVQTSVNDDFVPDIPGGLWKYFLYLQQTVPTLIGEINNRSATNEELIIAMQRAYEIGRRIKDPSDGNASLFVLGIEIDAQTPGPYTRQDVIDIMSTIASTGTYLRQAVEQGAPSPIIEELERIIQFMLVVSGGISATIHDVINTALFEYVPDSIRITGEQDGIKLKSVNEPEITDPADPGYTAYVKPALLPDVGNANVSNGVITVVLGQIPFPPMSPESEIILHLSYQIRNKGAAHGDHLHTDNDGETYVSFIEPNHLIASTPDLSYDNEPRTLFFPTPIVACDSDFTVEKFVGASPDNIIFKTTQISVCQQAYYRVVVTNYTDAPLVFPLLYDSHGARTIEQAVADAGRRILAQNFTVAARDSLEFTFQYPITCEDTSISDFAVLETEGRRLYDQAGVLVQEGFGSYTVQYLDHCTGCRIHPDKLVEPVSLCADISVISEIIQIPCYCFLCARPERLSLCDGQNIIKIYYTPCQPKGCKKCCCMK